MPNGAISAETAKGHYRRFLTESVTIRRYTGTGPIASRPKQDVTARARVTGYDTKELVGTIVQGDRKAIVYADDITDGGMTLPLTTNDRCIVNGKEMAIIAPDGETRKVDDVLIAYELQIRG